MLYTIYRVTHIESGKYYIGKHQTLDPNDGYMGSGKLILNAVKKHGVEAFQKEVLHAFETEDEMNAKEAELVTAEFCLREGTYNLCPGGHGGWGYVNSQGHSGWAKSWANNRQKALEASSKGGKITGGINMKKAWVEGKIKPPGVLSSADHEQRNRDVEELLVDGKLPRGAQKCLADKWGVSHTAVRKYMGLV